MKTKMSRREMVRSMSGIAVGAGISTISFNRAPEPAAISSTASQISVKISPPGPRSLALLEEVKKYVGNSNYSGLYGVGLKDGNGVYISDVDDNVYIDCLTSASGGTCPVSSILWFIAGIHGLSVQGSKPLLWRNGRESI